MNSLIEVLIVLITLGNAVWAVVNWRVYKQQIRAAAAVAASADQMKVQAQQLLRDARRISAPSPGYRVCESCGKIVEGPCPDCISRALKVN